MNKFLVDASVIIDFLRKKDKLKSLYYKLASEELFVSIITHTELFSGKSVWESKTAKSELESLFSDVTILPLSSEISNLNITTNTTAELTSTDIAKNEQADSEYATDDMESFDQDMESFDAELDNM